jgi:hypothetical protein
MCGWLERYGLVNRLIICSFAIRMRHKVFSVNYNFDIKFRQYLRTSCCCRNALEVRSEVPDLNLGPIAACPEATSTVSNRVFRLFILLLSALTQHVRSLGDM